jgi:N-acetylneuraminate lyase
MPNAFRGILPAIITPMDDDGKFVASSFESLIARMYAAGVDGLYVCGQAGEGYLQPVEQRKRVLEVAVRCSPPGKLVIAQIGASTSADALELARHAASAGAHAVSSLPPMGQNSFAEIRHYYETLAAQARLPLLVYHYPDMCPEVTADRAMDLCSIPNVAGLKFTDYDLFRLSIANHRGITVFNGRDEVLAAGLLMGARGGIGAFYNLFPATFVRIYQYALESRWEDARAVQHALNPVLMQLFQFPFVPAIRAALLSVGLDCGHSPPPRRRLTADEPRRVQEIVSRSSLPEGVEILGEQHATPLKS